MTSLDIAGARLFNQHLAGAPFETPAEAVRRLGAVQSQDYGAAKWALGLRVRGATDAAVEQAFNDGAILRTHVLRPTWHFVTPADIRWMQALTAPRVRPRFAYAYARLGLDQATLARSNALLEKSLRGGKQLTRTELVVLLRRTGLATDDSLRTIHILASAELDGIICSGPRRGKQHTYALLDERVPPAKSKMARDEAVAELARRYFTSRGPATLKDFMWWSGLAAADARAGVETNKAHLAREVVDGETYWLPASGPVSKRASRPASAYLLPNFDEYLVGYVDRSAISDTPRANPLDSRGSILSNAIVIDGQAAGVWRRTFRKGGALIAMQTLAPLTPAKARAVTAAARRYGEFLGMEVTCDWAGRDSSMVIPGSRTGTDAQLPAGFNG